MKFRKRHFTKPREEIQWYPSIDKEICNNCQICYNFCFKKVYNIDDQKVVYVDKPYECVLLCTGCVDKCPQGAISFPNRKDFEKYVVYED